MRLVSIINVWADAVELLPHCINNMANCGVNGIIIIWSEASNYGEIEKDYLPKPIVVWGKIDFHIYQREPQFREPRNSETDKRNFGIQKARELGYTHFLSMDQDEMYEPSEFKKAIKAFEDPAVKGIVCNCQTYFGSPKLTIGLDITLVPFVHELTPTIHHTFNKSYPFAWERNQIRIDPTRSFNINSGVIKSELIMHHLSWCRSDYQKKIRNSTARKNLERSNILQQLLQPKEGDYIDFYRKHLTRSTVDFGIDEKLFIQSL